MNASTIRIVGIDANRTGIAPGTLGGFGMTGYGSQPTNGSSKIDYLFIRGAVQPSSIGHTVSSTKSNHLALYGFITFKSTITQMSMRLARRPLTPTPA
jgi:hypothetical protein